MRPVGIHQVIAAEMGGRLIEIGGEGYDTCQYVLTRDNNGTPVVWALVELDDVDREAISNGAGLWYSTVGGELPWQIEVTNGPIDAAPAPSEFRVDTATSGLTVEPGPAQLDIGQIRQLVSTLTQREREVLSHAAAGLIPEDIAQAMHRSPRTIKNHLSSIYVKLDVTSRTQAVILATRLLCDDGHPT